MTTDQLLAVVQDRGCRIEVEAGAPKLRGPREALTPELLRVLALHRGTILERLTPRPPEPVRDERPGLIEWRLGPWGDLVRAKWPGATDAVLVRAREDSAVPFGARGWRVWPHLEWQPLDTLPADWGVRPLVLDGAPVE